MQLTEKAKAKVEDLSGGMKRRLTIARSLINKPDLLLLDEPTTGLDPQARHQLWDRLFRLKQQGVTLVLTTHYMDEAEQLCDRLVVMDKGVIVAEGSPAELIVEHSTREVLELRFGVGEHEAMAAEGRGPRRPGRGAARPAAALHRRRRGQPPPPCTSAACVRCRRSYAGRPSRTCSSASPAGAWSTDDATTSRDAGTPVDRTTRPSLADLVPTMVPRLGDYWRTVYRRTWRGSVVTSFLMPFLYLTAMGVGLGSFVDDNSGPSALDGVSYLAYIAPGLLATTAMQTAIGESTFPSWAGSSGTGSTSRWRPLRCGSPTSWPPSSRSSAFRILLTCAVFLGVLAAYGAV